MRRTRKPVYVCVPTTNPKADSALKQLVDRVPVVLFRFRLRPERRFEYISDGTRLLVGYTPAEYYADPDLGFTTAHPDDRARLIEMIHEGDRTPAVVRWHRKDGRVIWAEQRLTPLYTEAGELVAVDGVVHEVRNPAVERSARLRAVGGLEIDLIEHRVTADGQAVHLTPSEFGLLVLLTESPGETVTRQQMMRRLWRSTHAGDGHTCEAHISQLRKKIEPDPRNPTRIVTVRGHGYRFSVDR